MGASLYDLPDELLITIASNFDSLKEFSLVSKRLNHISAYVAVWRTKDDFSHATIYEAIRTLRCLETWNRAQNLVENLCAHVRLRFVQDVHDRKMTDALKTLQSLSYLPNNVTVPEDDFLVIMDTLLSWVLIYPNIRTCDWFFPITVLVVLSRLPSPARVPEKQVVDIVSTIRSQIIQDLENGRYYFSSTMLRDLNSLTWKIAMPYNFFSSIVKAIRDSVVHSINNGQTDNARATLRVLRHLPVDTRIPTDFFLNVVETIRDRLERTISHGSYDTMKLLWVLGALPSTTRVPNNYFIGVVTHFWSRLFRDIKSGVGFDAIRILRVLRQLPLNTTISKEDFLHLEATIRNQIIQHLCNRRVRRAARMAEVLQHLSSIEEYAFGCIRANLEGDKT
jgi:hypothetical protein